MKEKRILRVFGQISDQYVDEAETSNTKSRRPRRAAWMGAVAAVLAVVLLGGILLRPDTGLFMRAAAAYEPDYTISYDGAVLDEEYLSAIRAFAAQGGEILLNGNDTTAYSPTALYTALSMVSELADSSSRDALLNALGVDSTEQLRRYSGDLWRYLCANPKIKAPGKVTVSNALWLNQDYTFNGETLQNLANHYYVASYTGDMIKDIPELVSKWVKKQTNNLLDCKVEPTNDTIAVLLSAIYFYDEWAEHFDKHDTTEGRFRAGTMGEHETNLSAEEWVPCNYMNRTQQDWAYYCGGGVTASVQYFKNGGKMLFILPDEGSSPADILGNAEILTNLLNWEELGKSTAQVEWAIPRFTMKKTLNLKDGLTALGLGELFDAFGNPLPLLSGNGTPAFIGKAEQGTAISIDEIGCEATSYVEIGLMEGALDSSPENLVQMHLTRPFVFAILSENDVPLFLGVINSPNG